AVMWVSLGEHDRAIGDYEAGLRLLPDGEVRYRIAALSGLAHCHEQRDELADAITRLAEAEKLYGDRRDHALAFLVWNRANLAAKVGQHERAEVAYREAMEMLDRWSDPQDVALCALDLAQLYVRRGERSKLRKLSEEILAWLPALRAHRLADGVMMEVIRCAKWGEVTSQMLRESKAKIEAKSGKTRSRR
ncbi:MAG: hypothetical protein MI919_08095, partial [Holophagales bacterium]|nr:hypothetical protein [Holophagales bacterium]